MGGGATPDNTNKGPKLGIGGWLMQEFHEAHDFVGREVDKAAKFAVSLVTDNSGLTGQAARALQTNNDRINAALEGNDLPETKTPPSAPPPKP